MRRFFPAFLALLCLMSCSSCAFAEGHGSSAWLTYWDADAAVQEVKALPGGFESLICFEAFYDPNGNILIPPETEALLEAMKALDAPLYLSLVNDVEQADGSYVQKSRDLLAQILSSPSARSSQVAKIMRVVHKYRLNGVEIDFENFKKDTELWSYFTEFLAQLCPILDHNGISLRVVMECGAPKYAEFPEGPIYSCMCYNLYGYHSGPGPKADRDFLEELGEDWKSVPGEVHMAFATGGFVWAGNTVEKALTEQDALRWVEERRASPTRDKDSGALKATVFEDKKYTVWYADGETLDFWRETLQDMGYTHFDLFRLGGNTADSLAVFLRGAKSPSLKEGENK